MGTPPFSYKPRIFRTKRCNDSLLFEEPLINVDLTPTGDVDPLYIDPNESMSEELPLDDDFYNFGINIFSTPLSSKNNRNSDSTEARTRVKHEVQQDDGIRLKTSDDRCVTPPPEPDLTGVRHVKQALANLKYLCPKCHFRSPIKEELEDHVTTHRTLVSKPRPCSKCLYVAKTVRELTNHRREAHPRTLPEDLPTLPTGEFMCPHCEFISFHRSNLRSHLRVHSQNTIFTCDKCPYTSITKVNIENHALRHLHTKKSRRWKFVCKHCGLRERTEKLLARHLILHGEGEMVQCTLCPYKTPYNHIMTQHTKICHGITMSKNPRKNSQARRPTRRTRNNDDQDYVPTEHVQLEFRPRRRLRGRPEPKKREEEEEEGKEQDQEQGNEQDNKNKESVAAPLSISSVDSSSASDSSDSDSDASSEKSHSGKESGSEKGDSDGESHQSGQSEAKRAKLDSDDEKSEAEDCPKDNKDADMDEENDPTSVLVLKRSGQSFTCVAKDDSQS